ncbi:hypothetical protein GCM10011323_35210 [Pontibacter amylolyticus]|uniref:Uncharacterized protein n=1 Tax=Pontibacter amylolyticus TaxID=1424080 RepID=A0ABQ1WFX6_9BACT|nr:hypothetical protein GCM10011323_35210 [Pontibacter amylolyticus]
MGVGALDKEKSKQKNQDDFKLADRSNTKSSSVHLASALRFIASGANKSSYTCQWTVWCVAEENTALKPVNGRYRLPSSDKEGLGVKMNLNILGLPNGNDRRSPLGRGRGGYNQREHRTPKSTKLIPMKWVTYTYEVGNSSKVPL